MRGISRNDRPQGCRPIPLHGLGQLTLSINLYRRLRHFNHLLCRLFTDTERLKASPVIVRSILSSLPLPVTTQRQRARPLTGALVLPGPSLARKRSSEDRNRRLLLRVLHSACYRKPTPILP